MISVFYDGAPVTLYSPVVFKAFVNQIKVSPSAVPLCPEIGI